MELTGTAALSAKTTHHNMFAASKTGGVVSSGDPYWTSVSLLTNFENNLTFQDGSTNNIALTRNGVVNPSLATPFTGGVGGSEYFNGSTGYVSGTTSTAAEFGTGDFTVEAFVYLTSGTTSALLFGSSGLNMYFGVAVNASAPIYRLTAYDGTTVLEQTAGTSFTLNAWNHVAWVRSGTTFTAYLNGASVYSTTNSKNITGTTGFQVGHSPNYVPYYWTGNISNFRIVKGTAVYTSAFTPPTAPLTAITNTSLLITGTGQGMFDNATFVDQGPNALTVTATGAPVYSGLSPFGNTYPGSVLFNGTSQYLSSPSNAAFDLGSSSFTVEAWVNPSSFTNGYAVASRYNFSGSASGWVLRFVNATTLRFVRGNDVLLDATVSASVGTWYHVAAVRNGSTLTLYFNGTQVAQATSIANFTDAATSFQTGVTNTATDYANGYTNNLRIVKGTAVYTANFSPSTTPLTAITNTSLLVRGDTGAFYDLSNSGVAETGVGSIAVTTQIKKFGSESGGFNGSSQYLTIPNTAASDLYTGDFTIEAWVNCSVLTGDRCIFATGWPIALYISGGAPIAVVKPVNAADPSIVVIAGSALTLNTWAHVAFTRQGQTYRIFTNGTLNNTTTVASGAPIASTAPYFAIGVNPVYAAYFAGNIDDIRLTKGVARYTATFTPPTTTFPTGP